MPTEPMTGSWVAARYGIDPVRVERLRRAGELHAVRADDSHGWRYPAWQFDEDGRVRPAVQRLLAAAREGRISAARLEELLDRRVGLVGGRSVRDLLLDGGEEQALELVRAAR